MDLNFPSIEHKIKRFSQVRAIRMRRKVNKDYYISRSDYEKEAIGICRNIIRHKDSQLLLTPPNQSDNYCKRYIINKTIDINVVIKEGCVDIINHTYQYNVPISGKAHNIISTIFDGHVEKQRSSMEDEMRSNVKHSLETIYEKVKI